LQGQPDGELRQVQLELVGRRQSAELLRARMLAVQLATPVPVLAVPDERLLIVESDDDPLIPPPMRAALRAAHPAARCTVIEGGGHYPYITRAAAYDAAVGDFLEL
jgi:pimeloyl-ACP methyl ester carboxylesterase